MQGSSVFKESLYSFIYLIAIGDQGIGHYHQRQEAEVWQMAEAKWKGRTRIQVFQPPSPGLFPLHHAAATTGNQT